MNEQEADTLKRAYGEEPQSEVDVNVDGTVVKKELVENQEQTETKDDDTLSYEELQAEAEALREFYGQAMKYTKPVDPNDDNSARTWDFEKIAEESGYDPSSLIKKGAKRVMENQEQEQQQQKLDPKPQQKQSEEVTFTRDQVASMINEAVTKAVTPLAQESKQRKAREIVDGMREKYKDFNKYQARIGELAKQFDVKTDKQLEALYFAAKGEDSSINQGRNTGLSETVQGSRFPQVEPDVADAIMSEIAGAGRRPSNTGIIQELTGGSALSPMD